MLTYYLPSIVSMSMVLMPFPWILSTSLSGFNFRLRTLQRHAKRKSNASLKNTPLINIFLK